MTTAAETLAPHFAAIAHQLGRIADALEAGHAAGGRPVSRCEATSPQDDYGPVRETEAVRSPHRAAEGHMTVGQLSAEHIGKLVFWQSPVSPVTVARIQHASDGRTGIYGDRLAVLPSDTPCTVIDDEARP